MTAQWWLGFHVSWPTLFMAVLWAACSWINPQSIDWAHYRSPSGSERERGRELKMALFPLEEVHFHLNEGGSPERVVSRPCACETRWLCSRRLLCLCVLAWTSHLYTSDAPGFLNDLLLNLMHSTKSLFVYVQRLHIQGFLFAPPVGSNPVSAAKFAPLTEICWITLH